MQNHLFETVTHETPLVRGETTITEVQLRKPQAGELRGLSLADVLRMEVDSLVRLLPRITIPSLTEHEVRQMDPADLMQYATKVSGFLLTKQAKGEEPDAYLTA